MEENTNYEALKRYTLEACNMKTFLEDMFTENGNMWIELIYAWDMLLEGGSDEIFEEACHIIMWGFPREYRRSPYDKIVELVIAEMLRDGDAFNAWDSCEFFENAVGYMSSEMDPDSDYEYRYSIEHYQYLRDRFLLKVRYSKAKYSDEKVRYEKRIWSYQMAIKKMVPAASEWSEDYWIDENHILDEIYKRYGVDYHGIDCLEYGRILIIMMGLEHSELPSEIVEAWCATNIKTLPLSLAKAIWPIFTEEKILTMFFTAVEEAEAQLCDREYWTCYKEQYIHPVGVFEHSSIYESWVYPLISQWNEDPEQYDPFIKERLFTVAINS
jgi:hypothetical protein